MSHFKTLLVLWIGLLTTIVSSAGTQQAATIIGWLEKDVYFDPPFQIVDDLVVPRLDRGPTVWHPTRKEGMWKYWYDLDFQANILSCTGSDAIPVIIKGLSNDDFYVRIIAAIALDKMLGLKHSNELRVQGSYVDLETMKLKRDPIDNAFIQVYRDRVSKLYPGILTEQAGAVQPATKLADKVPVEAQPSPSSVSQKNASNPLPPAGMITAIRENAAWKFRIRVQTGGYNFSTSVKTTLNGKDIPSSLCSTEPTSDYGVSYMNVSLSDEIVKTGVLELWDSRRSNFGDEGTIHYTIQLAELTK